MIAKRIEREPEKRDDFSHLGRYIASAKEKGEKLDKFWIKNCDAGTELADLETALIEIEAVRSMKPDIADKTYHLVLSFRPGDREKLSQEDLQDIERAFADALGFGDHQRVVGTHINTDNFHMHIAFNKVHPQTLRCHTPRQDFKTLAKTCRAMELRYGLEIDRGMTDGKDRNPMSEKARDLEAKTWQQSFEGHLREHREEIMSVIAGAGDWQALHEGLAEFDAELQKRGAGLVFAQIGGKGRMKASALDRSCSLTALTKRLGLFEAAPVLEPPATPEGAPAPAPDGMEVDRESTLPSHDDTSPAWPADDRPPEVIPGDVPPRPSIDVGPTSASPDDPPGKAPSPAVDEPEPAISPPAATVPKAPGRTAPGRTAPPKPPAKRPSPDFAPRAPKRPYKAKPLTRHPAMDRLWQTYRQERKTGFLRRALHIRNWRDYLLSEAHKDPMAMAIVLTYKEMFHMIGEAVAPSRRRRYRPPNSIQPVLQSWYSASHWKAPSAGWLKGRLEELDLRADEAGKILFPFRDAEGHIWALRAMDGQGQTCDIGNPGGRPGLTHVMDPDGLLEPGARYDGPVILSADCLTAAIVQTDTSAPVIVAPDEKSLVGLARSIRAQRKGSPIVIATPVPNQHVSAAAGIAGGSVKIVDGDREQLRLIAELASRGRPAAVDHVQAEAMGAFVEDALSPDEAAASLQAKKAKAAPSAKKRADRAGRHQDHGAFVEDALSPEEAAFRAVPT